MSRRITMVKSTGNCQRQNSLAFQPQRSMVPLVPFNNSWADKSLATNHEPNESTPTLTFLALQIMHPVLVLRWDRLEHWVIVAGDGLSCIVTSMWKIYANVRVRSDIRLKRRDVMCFWDSWGVLANHNNSGWYLSYSHGRYFENLPISPKMEVFNGRLKSLLQLQHWGRWATEMYYCVVLMNANTSDYERIRVRAITSDD